MPIVCSCYVPYAGSMPIPLVRVKTIAATPCPLRLIGRRVPAGFPSPADDYLEGELDLQAYLIDHPAATFLLTVDGPSMEGAGILSGDKVIVDRSLSPKPGRIVIGVVHGEMTIKRLVRSKSGQHALVAEPAAGNPASYPPLPIDEASPFEIWGVVTGVIRRMERG